MKMMKAMKKLKFWSRKKKKKRAFFIEHPPPPSRPPPPPPQPPPCHCQYQNYCHSFEPSAPPLPASFSSWVEYDYENQEAIYAKSEFIPFTSSSQDQVPPFAPQEINSVPEITPQDPTKSASSASSYQQYMVPNPVYGVPVAPQVRRERRGGAFGCVFAFGARLFRCFFPCFHIREVKN